MENRMPAQTMCPRRPSVSIDLLRTGRVYLGRSSLALSNTTTLHAAGSFRPQLLHEWRQERVPPRLRHATAGQPLRDLHKHLGGTMARGDFRDHLAVVGRRAEQLRIERYRRDRLAFDRLGEFAYPDFRP